MMTTRFHVLLATCLWAAAGCAENEPTDAATSSVMPGPTGGGTSGSSSGGGASQGMQEPANTSGTSSGGPSPVAGNTGIDAEEDAAVPAPVPAGCTDSNKSTRGNTCPGVVTCGNAVEACSLTTQNCCVTDYKPDAASCNEGSTCKGLASAACDGPEDCSGGQVCCISVSLTTSAPFAAIQHRCVADASKCTGGGLVNRLLCHTDAECAAGEGCEPIGNLPWWGICK